MLEISSKNSMKLLEKRYFFNTYKSRFNRKNAQRQFKNYNYSSEIGALTHFLTSLPLEDNL